MTNIPTFSAGERLTAAKLNRLADALRELQREAAASRITSVNGGTFSRTAGGTTLDVRRAAPPQVPAQQTASPQRHPFKVEVLEVAGERLIGVFEPWVYVLSTGSTPNKWAPTAAADAGYYGEPGARFKLLPTPTPGRHILSLNVRFIPVKWAVDGGDGVGDEPWFVKGRGMSSISLDWDDAGDGDTIGFHVADVTRSVDEAGAESFAVVQHLRSTPFIPNFLPDPNKLMTGS